MSGNRSTPGRRRGRASCTHLDDARGRDSPRRPRLGWMVAERFRCEVPALPLRASSIGAGARGTALHPLGNWKVARPSSPTPFGQVAAALLPAAVVLEPAASAKATVSARPSHRAARATSGAWLGRRRLQQWTISDSPMLSAAVRSGAAASRQTQQPRATVADSPCGLGASAPTRARDRWIRRATGSRRAGAVQPGRPRDQPERRSATASSSRSRNSRLL